MRILVVHRTYPAQFRRLVPHWLSEGHDVHFVHCDREWHSLPIPKLTHVTYTPHRTDGGPSIHPYLRRLESAVIHGQSVYRALVALRESGYCPDVIINHVGFGVGLYLRDVYPHVKRIGLFEWYYNSVNSDVDFLPPACVTADHALRLRTWNSLVLSELADCDACVTPTKWQKSQFPPKLQSGITVIHEGVDCHHLSSLATRSLPLPEPLLQIPPGAEVLTYVSRCFEEYRGFQQAMETISLLQRRRPNLHALIAGSDGAAYGTPRADGVPWSEWARENISFDPKRTHWLGSVQSDTYHSLLSISNVHLYLTVPFILSWSLIEVMAAGVPVVASDTPPVREVIDNMTNGILVDFFDSSAQADAVCQILDCPSLASSLARSSVKASQFYSSTIGADKWDDLISTVTKP